MNKINHNIKLISAKIDRTNKKINTMNNEAKGMMKQSKLMNIKINRINQKIKSMNNQVGVIE